MAGPKECRVRQGKDGHPTCVRISRHSDYGKIAKANVHRHDRNLQRAGGRKCVLTALAFNSRSSSGEVSVSRPREDDGLAVHASTIGFHLYVSTRVDKRFRTRPYSRTADLKYCTIS